MDEIKVGNNVKVWNCESVIIVDPENGYEENYSNLQRNNFGHLCKVLLIDQQLPSPHVSMKNDCLLSYLNNSYGKIWLAYANKNCLRNWEEYSVHYITHNCKLFLNKTFKTTLICHPNYKKIIDLITHMHIDRNGKIFFISRRSIFDGCEVLGYIKQNSSKCVEEKNNVISWTKGE